jgi:hypothetical protein
LTVKLSFRGQALFKTKVLLSAPLIHYGDPYPKTRLTQRAVTVLEVAAHSGRFLAQADSVKAALSRPAWLSSRIGRFSQSVSRHTSQVPQNPAPRMTAVAKDLPGNSAGLVWQNN